MHDGVRSTHQIWFIDEVIRNILVHLPSNGCHSTLVSCALVSRALSEPALDALWYKISGLLPLFRLLPCSLSEVRKESGDGNVFIPHETIDAREWTRFTSYARRVRRFHYHYAEGPGERLGERAFAALVHRASLSGGTLLPNLQELSWLQFSDIAQCLPFLPSSLQRVTIYVQAVSTPAQMGGHSRGGKHNASGGGYAGLLPLIDARSPRLEELSLEGIDFDLSFLPTQAFTRLRTLHLGSASISTSAILEHCSKMPRLASLSLVLRRSSDTVDARLQSGDEDQRRRGTPNGLSVLEVLRVAGVPADIEDVLYAIDSPVLHTVALAVSVPEYDADGWTRCTTLLSARFATSVQTLRAECTRSSVLVPSTARAFAHYVRPLLPLRELRECTVTVNDPAGVVMVDGDVESMAVSWPSLTALEVSFRGGRESTFPTITSLPIFARRCPALATLRLPVRQDASVLPSSEGPLGCGRGGLRELWFFGVWFSRKESDRITSFLLHHFPNVDLQHMFKAGVLRVE